MKFAGFLYLFFVLNTLAQSTERPNFLIIMSDQHAPQFSSIYGHKMVKTPMLDKLAKEGVVFENAYTTSPICVPSRMSFITGRYVHNIKIWDNGAPLAEDQPTLAHILRANGYDMALSGKIHFRGHDQLHGFQTQLGIDMNGMNYPNTPNWEKKPVVPQKSRKTMGAGAGENSVILSDNLVTDKAIDYIKERKGQKNPWALMVGLVSPHPPFKVPEKYLKMYPLEEIDLPQVSEEHLSSLHPSNHRHRNNYGFKGNDLLPKEVVKEVRATYFGMVSFMDDKIKEMINVLERTGQLDNTVIIYFSDHGEMLGEHGMWSKINFYEHSVRIPMIISYPKKLPRNHRVNYNVSTVDLTATIIELAGIDIQGLPFELDGRDLGPLMRDPKLPWVDEVFSEYYADNSRAPMAMLKRGSLKLNYYHNESPELFDLVNDPGELNDLANNVGYASVLNQMLDNLLEKWNPETIQKEVLASQRKRRYLTPYMYGYIERERAKWPAKFTSVLNAKPN